MTQKTVGTNVGRGVGPGVVGRGDGSGLGSTVGAQVLLSGKVSQQGWVGRGRWRLGVFARPPPPPATPPPLSLTVPRSVPVVMYHSAVTALESAWTSVGTSEQSWFVLSWNCEVGGEA